MLINISNPPREDAVLIGVGPSARWFVPTQEATKWVSTWEEFRAAGGQACWSEDQTSIELTLPEGYKFSIKFERSGRLGE